MIEAPCTHEPDLWFDWGLPGSPGFTDRVAEAKRRCVACPLIAACRAVADEHEGSRITNLFGIWAAETPAERLARRGLTKPTPPAPVKTAAAKSPTPVKTAVAKSPKPVKTHAPTVPARPRLSPAEQSRRARARLDQRVAEARKAWWR